MGLEVSLLGLEVSKKNLKVPKKPLNITFFGGAANFQTLANIIM